MKKLIVLALMLSLFNCKKDVKQESVIKTVDEVVVETPKKVYLENITKVFDAHGTLEAWNSFNSLSFTMNKPKGDELTITDLKDRRSFIETANFKLGYNGKEAWLKENEGFEYKGNKDMYYNLMFYFYAMPYVLADDGITYTNVDALEFEGKIYPGIKISYGSGVGASSDDEYILYYDDETNKMAWLGYTFTYGSNEKNNNWSFIRYSDWQTVEGLILPKTLSWYKAEGFKIGEKRNDLKFADVKLSKEKMETSQFEKPLK
jgi:hypothetical protein